MLALISAVPLTTGVESLVMISETIGGLGGVESTTRVPEL